MWVWVPQHLQPHTSCRLALLWVLGVVCHLFNLTWFYCSWLPFLHWGSRPCYFYILSCPALFQSVTSKVLPVLLPRPCVWGINTKTNLNLSRSLLQKSSQNNGTLTTMIAWGSWNCLDCPPAARHKTLALLQKCLSKKSFLFTSYTCLLWSLTLQDLI